MSIEDEGDLDRANMASADEYEPLEYNAEGDYGVAGEKSDAESNANEDEEDLELVDLYLQHGAHRNWQLRKKHIVHQAKRSVPVKNGAELGNLLVSRSGKVWGKVMYNNVHIVGGVPLQGGKELLAPYVCFTPPEGSPETDDARWLRPVHSKVMEYLKTVWIEAINLKYRDPEKRKRVLEYYKPVLEWEAPQLGGSGSLNPVAMGTGDRGFLLMSRSLKSIAVRPPVQARKAPQESGEPSTSKKQKSTSSADTESVCEECPFTSLGPGSRVWRLGEVGRVVVNNGIDGNVYASVLS